jgi:hypothetical protein
MNDGGSGGGNGGPVLFCSGGEVKVDNFPAVSVPVLLDGAVVGTFPAEIEVFEVIMVEVKDVWSCEPDMKDEEVVVVEEVMGEDVFVRKGALGTESSRTPVHGSASHSTLP